MTDQRQFTWRHAVVYVAFGLLAFLLAVETTFPEAGMSGIPLAVMLFSELALGLAVIWYFWFLSAPN